MRIAKLLLGCVAVATAGCQASRREEITVTTNPNPQMTLKATFGAG